MYLADIPALYHGVAHGPGQALEPSMLLAYLAAATAGRRSSPAWCTGSGTPGRMTPSSPTPVGARFADLDRIHAADHRGEFFDVAVTLQAGASPQDLALAGRFAEAVYTPLLGAEAARGYRARLAEQAHRYGRDGSGIRLLPGLTPVIGSTEAEARSRFATLEAGVREDARHIGRVARTLGLDPATTGPEAPLTDAQLAGPPRDRLPTGFPEPFPSTNSSTAYRS
ncbi:LLM class flavin-dependent oxidoreductase [Streptomyces sp. NPDC059850]|uniref:LLM class flavin-dependent oxidoreductase n=1 Tax=Streptomyces sp. NPDC059850 TaxID=3346970 RepID=UPI00365400D5